MTVPTHVPTYVPAILTRQPELRALREVSPGARACIHPLFVAAPPPWDFVGDAPLVSPSEHLRSLPELLAASWRGSAMVDLRHLGDGPVGADGSPGVVWLARACDALGLVVVPVLGGGVLTGATPDAVPAVAEVASWGRRGLALRLERHEWPSVVGPRVVVDTVAAAGLDLADCDLVLDLGDRCGTEPAVAADLVRYELATIPQVARWRSIVVLATSLPAGAPRRRGVRHEWLLHRQLAATGELRAPVFGDYTVAHPDPLADLDLAASGAGRLRYTMEESWLNVESDATLGAPRTLVALDAGGSRRTDLRLPDMAVRVRGDRGFVPGHCSFEQLIDEMVASRHEPVSPAALRRLATRHHLELVVEQLRRLHGAASGTALGGGLAVSSR